MLNDRPTFLGFHAPAWAVGSIAGVITGVVFLFLTGAW